MSTHINTYTVADMQGARQSLHVSAPLEGHEQFLVPAGPWVSAIYPAESLEGRALIKGVPVDTGSSFPLWIPHLPR